MPTDEVENSNSTIKGRDSRFTKKPQMLPWEAERVPQRSRGKAELLYLDQNILNGSKTRRKNLAMAWIDYKKGIVNYLKMYKISHEVVNFIEKTMNTWRVELTAWGWSLAEAKIQICIFQRDVLSPLQRIIAMMPINRILRKCTAWYKHSRSQGKINHQMYI